MHNKNKNKTQDIFEWKIHFAYQNNTRIIMKIIAQI
jgi:hypothetical protein